MRWDDRQRAMLREMGIRLWLPPAAGGPAARDAGDIAVDDPGVVEPAVAKPAFVGSAVVDTASRAPLEARSPVALHRAPHPPTPDPSSADWPALSALVEGCTACGLCESRRRTVFGAGHLSADWMVVGEAPGEPDDADGAPFLGRPGLLLDNMLRAIGLSRAAGEPVRQVYLANAIKCRPPGNRKPTAEEFAQCAPYLMRQVRLVQPKVIVAMGLNVGPSLLGVTDPIGRLRGRVHRYAGVPLIVTYPPDYLLRNPEDKARAWDDLCLAVQTLRG